MTERPTPSLSAELGPVRRPVIASMFRYPIADHAAMANSFPEIIRAVAATADVHRFSYRSEKPHWLHDAPHVYFHEIPLRFRRNNEFDKWFKTLLWFGIAPVLGIGCRFRKVDLVYIEESLPVLPLLVQWTSGRPVLINGADIFWDVYLPDAGPLGIIKRMMMKLDHAAWRRLGGVITHTETFKAYMVEVGVPPDRVHVVREGCEPDVFYPVDRAAARDAFEFKDDEIIFLHHGVLHPNKAIDRILRFLVPIFDEFPTFRFVIVGSGPVEGMLQRLTGELGIADRVDFLGYVDGVDALNQLLSACDISLVMRRGGFADHFHMTSNLIHSLAAGSCILCPRLGGFMEIIDDGVNGALFGHDDAESFRDRLAELCRDPALRRRLGEGALHTARTTLAPKEVKSAWTRAVLDVLETAVANEMR